MQQHLNAIDDCAAILDQMQHSALYQQSVQVMQQRLDHVDNTLSAHVISDTLEHGGTWNFGSIMAQQHAQYYAAHPLSNDRKDYFEQLAQSSLYKQQQLEQDYALSFEEYLAQYR